MRQLAGDAWGREKSATAQSESPAFLALIPRGAAA